MSAAWDMTKEIERSRQSVTLKQRQLLYKTELKKLFEDQRKKLIQFDIDFLNAKTKKLDTGLSSIKQQLVKAGFQVTLTVEINPLLANIEKIERIEYPGEPADYDDDRHKCYMFYEDPSKKRSRVLNLTRKWVLNIVNAAGDSKSIAIFAIMAFYHEEDCKDLQESAYYSDPKVYMSFPRRIVYTTERGGKYSLTTEDVEVIRSEVAEFI